MFKLSSDVLANFRGVQSALQGLLDKIADIYRRLRSVEERIDGIPLGSSSSGVTLPIDATDVNYDNSTSGLAATTVQAAIDELSSTDPADTLASYILTLSPTAYWKCDETGGTTVNDYGSANVDLTLANTYTLEGGTLIANSTDRYIRFSSLSATDGKAEATSGLGLTMPLTGDWTVTWLVGGLLGTGEYMRALAIGGDGSSGTSANNYQLAVGIDNSKENLFAFWEYDAGSFELLLIDANMATVDSGRRLACAIVKDGTANTVTGYLDGIKIGSTSYTNEPSDGSGTMYTTIGAPNPFSCRSAVIGHVAFFNGTKLTDAQIANIARLAGRD